MTTYRVSLTIELNVIVEVEADSEDEAYIEAGDCMPDFLDGYDAEIEGIEVLEAVE